MYTIKSRFTGEVIFEGTNLEGAYLEGAYLEGANLEGANLKGANLGDALLRGAYLKGASLEGAYLEGANLEGANLEGANLKGANLEDALLRGAYLKGASLEDALLRGAYLKGANLEGAILRGASLKDAILPHFQIVPTVGGFIGYKATTRGVITVLIPEDAKRTSTLVGRKCRASHVVVLGGKGCGGFSPTRTRNAIQYNEGATIYADSYDDDIRVECTKGIHFFMTEAEAREWK